VDINIFVEHVQGLTGLPDKSRWRDIDEELCRLSDQSTKTAHPLRVGVHMTYAELFEDYDQQKLRYHLKEAWPLFWKKGEVVLTS
jgi:hypothetical protein